MKIAVITSTKDPAGMNIRQNLIEQGFKEGKEGFDSHKVCMLQGTEARIYTTDTDSIHCENIDKKIAEHGFDADLFIFATKHSSEAGVRSLSVHAPGNWGNAELGGKDRQLCIAPASCLKAALLKLDEIGKSLNGFEMIQECTHHGPFIEKPCMFIEIGSSAAEWSNKEAGKIIAETIIHLIRNKPKPCKTIFGIGGLHHTPEFSKIARRTGYSVGHVCPKYNLENLDEGMIRQALERNSGNEGEIEVVLDWKGLKAGKERVVKLLDEAGVKFKKTKDFI